MSRGINKPQTIIQSGGDAGLVYHQQTFNCLVPTPILITAGQEFNLFNSVNGFNSPNGSSPPTYSPLYDYISDGEFIKAPSNVEAATMLVRMTLPATAGAGGSVRSVLSIIRRPLTLGGTPEGVLPTLTQHSTNSSTLVLTGNPVTNHTGATDPYKLYGFALFIFQGEDDITINQDFRVDITSVFREIKPIQ